MDVICLMSKVCKGVGTEEDNREGTLQKGSSIHEHDWFGRIYILEEEIEEKMGLNGEEREKMTGIPFTWQRN